MMEWMRARGLLAATALAVGGLSTMASPVLAQTNYAVVIAVTAYPNLPPKASLIGPNHDAGLVRDFLQKNSPIPFLPDNVKLLADGIPSNGSPTHAAILSTLADVASKAVRGDFVYLHFSGHGAQQPEIVKGSESDGLDEIFLPSDTAKWQNREKGVPNALMDDEIGSALNAIRDKGAFVWFVIDACHSGTATRGAPIGEDAVTERKVDSSDLGIPDAEMAAAEAASSRGMEEREAGVTVDAQPTGAEPITKGGLVAFFAAQTIETTPEMPLPKGNPDAEKFGLFTYTIFSKIAENPNMTYRQLGHAVLQQYAADSRQRPTPLFEGELDARVFGMEKLDTVMQWPIEVKDDTASVPAGLLHRLSAGTKLAILPSPASELSEAVGYVEVQTPKNLTSRVVPVAFDGKPALKLADLPANGYARLAELAVDFRLTVARPAPTEGLGDAVKQVNAMLDQLIAGADNRFNVQLVEPGSPADIRLAVLRENAIEGAAPDASNNPALWFLPSSGEILMEKGTQPPLVAIDPANDKKLADGTKENLVKIFRATSLSRLAAASDYRPEDVNVEFKIKRQGKDELEPLVESTVPIVNPGDEVHIVAKNTSSKLVDINILYVGSDYSITHIDAQRLVPGANVEEGLLAFSDTSFGMERMIAVLTEAPPLSEMEDLKFLEQGKVPLATRKVGGEVGFADMLQDIGLAPATRSAMKLGDKGGAKGAVMIFPMETVPRAQ